MSDSTRRRLPFLPSGALTRMIESALLSDVRCGTLSVVFPNAVRLVGRGDVPGPEVVVQFRSWSAVMRYVFEGELAFAEAYMAGQVDIADLGCLFDWYIANHKHDRGKGLWGGLAHMWHRVHHLFVRKNSRQRAKRNISLHYDLGNDFYALWLDPSMTYSSADYAPNTEADNAPKANAAPGDGDDLAAAQQQKYARIAAMAAIRPGAHVLEVGCGWGGFADHISQDQDTDVAYTGITISHEQLDYARDRLAGRPGIDLRFEDYRDTTGHFDAIVSIEMFEAVGEKYWPTYFDSLYRLLKPGCTAAIQTITIHDDGFDSYRTGVDFIQKYIFPGGLLPSVSIFNSHAEAAGFTVEDRYDFGQDYARTLSAWRQNFIAAWPDIQALGFDMRFYRMWLYYLHYCEAGFKAGRINVSQFALRKPL